MKQMIAIAFLIAAQADCFNRDFFNGIHNTIDGMEKHFARIQEEFSTFKTEPSPKSILSSKVSFNKDSATMHIMNITSGEIDAQFDGQRLTIKHPAFTAAFTKDPYSYGGVIAKLVAEHNEETSTNNQSAHNYYSSFQQETVNLNHPVDFEKTQITYDEDHQELLITFFYKQNRQLPITIVRKVAPPETESSENEPENK